MSYTINRTDGTILTIIEDGTVDTTTDLSLIGKNFIGFGKSINDNFVSLLENFSNETAPNSPLSGQLWWDRSTDQLKVFSGSVFKSLGVVRISETQPIVNSLGDLWYDTTNNQLKQFDGANFDLVGPVYTSAQGVTGAFAETLSDGSANRVVVVIRAAGTRLAILSDVEFIPVPSISGFSTIRAGINLNSSLSLKLQGTATDSEKVGGVGIIDLMRSDQDSTTTGTITISNDGGLVLGENETASISVDSADLNITNSEDSGNIHINVNNGSTITAIAVDGATANVAVGNLTASGSLSASSLTGQLTTSSQPAITLLGTLGNLNVSGTVTTSNVTAGNISGTITTAAQPNITSIGTLSSLTVSGNISANGISLGSSLPIGQGGTGATSESDARDALDVVCRSGDTMTGFLTLHSNPTSNLHAATKQYVDSKVSGDLSGYATETYVINAVNSIVPFTGYVFSQGNSVSITSSRLDIFPPSGKTMANLEAFIPSVSADPTIFLSQNTSLVLNWSALPDRIRVFAPSSTRIHYLAIWRN